jgi:apolipoprotein N-acyltransferase
VVWSETAIDTDLDQAPGIVDALAELARDMSVSIVSGAPRSLGGRSTNSVVLVTPDSGLVDSYDKQRLVPFSEYDPPLFSWLSPLRGRSLWPLPSASRSPIPASSGICAPRAPSW